MECDQSSENSADKNVMAEGVVILGIYTCSEKNRNGIDVRQNRA